MFFYVSQPRKTEKPEKWNFGISQMSQNVPKFPGISKLRLKTPKIREIPEHFGKSREIPGFGTFWTFQIPESRRNLEGPKISGISSLFCQILAHFQDFVYNRHIFRSFFPKFSRGSQTRDIWGTYIF